MLHDFVFGDIILIKLFLVLRVIAVLVLDFPAQSGSSLLLWYFETTRESASFFVHPLGLFGDLAVLDLILLQASNLGHLALWIKWANAQA